MVKLKVVSLLVLAATTSVRSNIVPESHQVKSIELTSSEIDPIYVKELSPYEQYFFTLFPWKRARHFERIETEDNETFCREESSIDEFPDDLFTQEQRQKGAFLLHVIGAIYFFTICGLVINNYFLPSIQCFCDDLKITPDVAAAVFMATATATPELCTNTISIFIADSDMGIGTVIGSLMWNVLGVAALASIATSKPVRMDWLPITRDCLIFAFNAIVLFIFVWDGKVYFWEALLMLLLILIYYVIMFQNERITRFVRRKIETERGCCGRSNYDVEMEKRIEAYSVYDPNDDNMELPPKVKPVENDEKKNVGIIDPEKNDEDTISLWNVPWKQSKLRVFFWFYSWPIRLVLAVTIPNPNSLRKMYPLSFFLCICWIGLVTYFIFWMMVVIAHTFSIPESVMGLTVFAIGGCTPEMITSFIMARRGNSGVGVAHSLGAASLAILISMGLPWFLRSVIDFNRGGSPYILVTSNGMEYTVISLVAVVASLYLCLACTGFTLKKITGFGLITFYFIFITLAVLVEVNVFFPNEDC